MRELPIVDGSNVLDDNLLACSEGHVRKVFAMLARKENRPCQFTGGLEAKILKPWHVEELYKLRPKQMFFAYDTPDDYEPLREAARMLFDAGFTRASRCVRAYVLIGYPRDTMDAAEKRLNECVDLGVVPMPMLWRSEDGGRDPEWVHMQKEWARPWHYDKLSRTATADEPGRGTAVGV